MGFFSGIKKKLKKITLKGTISAIAKVTPIAAPIAIATGASKPADLAKHYATQAVAGGGVALGVGALPTLSGIGQAAGRVGGALVTAGKKIATAEIGRLVSAVSGALRATEQDLKDIAEGVEVAGDVAGAGIDSSNPVQPAGLAPRNMAGVVIVAGAVAILLLARKK